MPDDQRNGALEDSLRAALGAPTGRARPADGPTPDGDPTAREAEARAVAAFRAARDAGLHRARPTRRRDDWTPATGRRRPVRSVRTAVAALIASVTLGGVAVATGGLPDRFPGTPSPAPEPRAVGSTPAPAPGRTRAGSTPPGPPETSTPVHPDGHPPPPAGGRDDLCRAYGKPDKAEKPRTPEKPDKGQRPEKPEKPRMAEKAGEDATPGQGGCGHPPHPGHDPAAGPGTRNGVGPGTPSPRPGKAANGRATAGPYGATVRPGPPESRNG
ncbi:hypothetical protein ACFVZH_30725 [Streptomyces sp. NPDC059534]|uniref:hypothetical protein n=1 Tax=Streptomyces sp. NPDC059534 TaxID=3346859 RepID=UPI003684D593